MHLKYLSEFVFIGKGDDSFLENYAYELTDDPQNTPIVIEDPQTGEKTTMENIETIEFNATSGSATLIAQTAAAESAPFSDVTKNDWFYDTVVRAKSLGVVKGESASHKKEATNFNPGTTINLAQALRMMYQSAQIDTASVNFADAPLPPDIPEDTWYAKDMAYSAAHGILMQNEEGKTFPPDKTLTRSDLALIIYRLYGTKNEEKTFGYASWYGDGLSVIRPKENVEYVDRYMTTAHKTLPMGTIVRVTNMWNGKQVDVVVNDRGPYVTGRVLDLSKSAFDAIGDSGTGIMAIQMQIIMVPSN